MTKDLRSDRWTCPNDRNLQLRSKLNAGWSCHTKTSLKKDSQLSENELIEIQKVLQRSEMLEKHERNRVSRLVERLENMKRNASQSKPLPNCCALCGDFFSIVRSAQNQCSACQKVLCTKCCIDTPFSADDDSWKSSTSSFLSRTTRRNSIYGTNQKSLVYLCRLCSEQREFLKKSGAWFLKKYPSYLSDNKYNSATDLNHIENNQATASFVSSHSTNGSPSFMSKTNNNKNPNISPSDSLSFRFWKAKEGNNAPNLNNFAPDSDTFSFVSTETDLQQDTISNDCTSATTRTVSSENFICKSSPVSFNKKQDHFSFSPTSGNRVANGVSSNSNANFNLSPSSTSNTINNINNNNSNCNNNNIKNNYNNKNVSSLNDSVKSKNRVISSISSDSNNEDDDKTNSNMANYNYYSNILNNISSENNNNKTNSSFCNSISKKPSKDSSDAVFEENSTKTANSHLIETNRSEKHEEKSNLKLHNDKNPTPSPVVRQPENNKNQKFKLNPIQDPTLETARKSIANGVLNSSLSASASNLDIEPENLSNSSITTLKQDTSLFTKKKNKFTEWCSTQLSMEKDNDNNVLRSKNKTADFKHPVSTDRSASTKSKSLKMSSILGSNTLANSISSLTSKKKTNQKANNYGGNLEKMCGKSIAASTSSAVASASGSLATSLNQLNKF